MFFVLDELNQNNLSQTVDPQAKEKDEQLGLSITKTIQEAIDIAQEGGIIKISPGLYKENIYINKPGLRLEPKEKTGDIIIFAQKSAAITIDLDLNQKCFIIGIKLCHSGFNEEEVNSKLDEYNRIMARIYNYEDKSKHGISADKSIEKSQKDSFEFDRINNINQDSKKKSQFGKNKRNKMNQSISNIDQEQLEQEKGNKKQPTIGILVKSSDCLIKDSNIHSHQLGGIHLWGNKNTKIKIQNNKVQNCLPRGNGICCGGPDCQIFIEGNDISKNFIGVNIGIANQAQIVKNQIYFNSFGIEIISGDPFVFNNQIEKNLVAGILTRTFGEFRCDGIIKRNEYIRCNKEYGIVCQGENNFTKIEKNENISYNKKSGIKVEDKAHAYIYRNSIFKNIGQGILIVESASAIIESNEVADNLKANIALGGFGSQNSVIVSNKIKGGRCEGIFLIDASECWILRNKIYENNDGIIMVMSIPWVEKNEIYRNKSNGVMAIKDSRPKFQKNLIEQNGFIGLFIRDKSNGDITGNNIWGNKKTNLLVEQRIKKLDNILKVFQEEGDIRIPQNYRCTLI
ncbi:Pectin lyase fold/virulence factor [Pseudocohnilembus persalinus]|uniref:Pectin lyase fold/virulence factor n=1 Tax=Pseudocohnilembus persalinus TaxID=266149 RepID=A0A0V0QUF9_PSEPJ|nr:Pectin lyase fold/virulence factor [Pseudocohnilembus persalinus]|eukprot:KRX06051.1 Pectin lyase fold/virulence factor [Pseudocohnilembus persalinus]